MSSPLLSLVSLVAGVSAVGAPSVHFPKNFRWCVATSAHQIEGHNTNSDWWDWEQLPGHIKNDQRSGNADDDWNRVSEDVGLLEQLGVGEYRFSVEWARIEPVEGQWDWDAVAHYRHELELLKSRGIEPMVTLQHFSLPRWFRNHDAWEWDRAPELFARYAAFVMHSIGPEVHDWITINEPMVTLLDGYVLGIHPPGIRGGIRGSLAPMVGMLRAHAEAYHRMHSEAAVPIRIGLAHHLRVFDPASSWSPFDRLAAGNLDYAFNWSFAGAIETGHLSFGVPYNGDIDIYVPGLAGTQDFIGVNYYSRDMVRVTFVGAGFELGVPHGADTNDMGWEIYPDGFYRVLKAAARHFPGKPIFVTENGIADAKDAKRPRFLDEHLAAMARAINEGVPVEGYCHWSLIDNFEWAEGFTQRFGLFAVDYDTQVRTPRASALRYAEIIRKNAL